MSFDFPIVIGSSGLQPQDPGTLRAQLITNVAATNPGYTANLPASLIEDVSSTEVGGIALCDQAKVELVNSLTPQGANELLLLQQGQMLGLRMGQTTNTSVVVVFSGTIGYVITNGFLVADGSGNNYQVQAGGVIGSSGQSNGLTAIAVDSDTLAPPAGSVTTLVTSIPSTLLNPPVQGAPTTATTGGTLAATTYYYVVTALNSFGETTKSTEQSVTTTGSTSENTVSWAAVSGATGYKVYRGTASGAEGTYYAVSGGTSTSFLDTGAAGTSGTPPLSNTTALVLTVTNAQAGTPAGTAETFEAYRARVLQALLAACVGTPRFIKTLLGNVSGVSARLISVQQATGGLRIVVSGGDTYQVAYAIFMSVSDVATLQGSGVSSSRNITVSLHDYPDTYNLPYVNSPQQVVTLSVTWNTTLANFTGGAAFPGLTQGPLSDYINSVPLGQPLNVMEMNRVFQDAVAALLDPSLLTRLVIEVFINGTLTNPTSGTYAIPGDPESYFYAVPTGISVAQG